MLLLLSIGNISRATVIDLSITSGIPASQEMEYSRLLTQISWYENVNTIDLPTPDYNYYNKYNGNGETSIDVDLDFFFPDT